MAKSKLEERFAELIGLCNIPAPKREYKFALPRRWQFDFAWPEQRVAVEIEGGAWSGGRHTRGKGYASDCEKYNTAALRGWIVLRYATGMITNDAVLQVVSAIKERTAA